MAKCLFQKKNKKTRRTQMTLNEKIVEHVEEHDMDFNTANVSFALINAMYSDQPIEELKRAKMFLERRIGLVTKQINNGNFNKKVWKENGGKQ